MTKGVRKGVATADPPPEISTFLNQFAGPAVFPSAPREVSQVACSREWRGLRRLPESGRSFRKLPLGDLGTDGGWDLEQFLDLVVG